MEARHPAFMDVTSSSRHGSSPNSIEDIPDSRGSSLDGSITKSVEACGPDDDGEFFFQLCMHDENVFEVLHA